MGQPHPTGRAALKMLENEGFQWDCYIDIFDGGPTVTAATDQVHTVRDSDWMRIGGELAEDDEAGSMMLASGTLHDFTACIARARRDERGELRVEPDVFGLLNVEVGDRVLAIAR